MDIFEAVESRIACRWFFDKAVDPKIVKDLIVKAQRATSGGNIQSWNVYALMGEPLKDFKRVVAERIADEGDLRLTAKGEYMIYPDQLWGAYKARREAHGAQMYGSLGIPREDISSRVAQHKTNYQFFNAPVGLLITIDRRLGPAQWVDIGCYVQTLAHLARGYGLDTCPQVSWARIYDTVGAYLKLPDNEMLVLGISLGYGDRKHKVNDYHSPRAALDEFAHFYGFD